MGKKLTKQQKKFKRATEACFKTSTTVKSFGRCMSKEMKGKKKKGRKR